MGAATLIVELRRRGIFLRVEGDRLVASPASLLTGADFDRIRRLKPALIDEINTGTVRRRPRQHCVDCGATLPGSSWARCPPCDDAAYLARSARTAADTPSGRSPPHDDQPVAA